MLLPGRLSASTLGDLLGLLHRGSTTGLLELKEISGPPGNSLPGRRHRIHLTRGLVMAVETGLPVPPIGEILRRDGLMRPESFARLIGRLDAGDRRVAGEILVADGLARAEAVRAGLARQTRARLEALFTLRDAVITFHAARPLTHGGPLIAPLGPVEFLHGRPRLRDRTGYTPPPPSVEPIDEVASEAPRPHAQEKEPPRSRVRPVTDDARARARRLLGVSEGAALSEVRRAFRQLASRLHPDKHAARGGAGGDIDFAELSAAYHLLVA